MTPDQEKQYQQLIEARNFHYNNLNKWLMSFYAIIAALFVALYKLYGDDSHQLMELCVAIVGYVVSIAALLSGKGYYYWETNWIMLVHYFEKMYLKDSTADAHKENRELQFRNRVYSVFANFNVNNNIMIPTAGANISTTRVALAITWFISMLWGLIVVYLGIKKLYCECIETVRCRVVVAGLISFFVTQVLIYIGGKCFPSDLQNLDNLKL